MNLGEALQLYRSVLKREPLWADAHYWYGRAIDRNSTQQPKTERRQVLKQVLAQYDRAEQLDKTLHFNLLISRSGPLAELGKPRESLAAFDGYIRAYPAFAQDLEERFPGYVAKTRGEISSRYTEKVKQHSYSQFARNNQPPRVTSVAAGCFLLFVGFNAPPLAAF